MKQLFLLSTLILLSTTGLGQNLTISQLLEVKKRDLGEAEEYLASKGWEFLNANEPTFEDMGTATFTYNKDDMSDRAESFLLYMYSGYSGTTRVSIQVNNKKKYNEYLNAIKGYGCKMISSKIKDGKIVKTYRGKTTTFEIASSTSENFWGEESAAWHFLIAENSDYDLLREEE